MIFLPDQNSITNYYVGLSTDEKPVANEGDVFTESDTGYIYTYTSDEWVKQQPKTTSFGITIDGQGGVISTGSKGYVVIPYDATITGWYIVGDQTGSISIDLLRNGTSIIDGGNLPTLSSTQRANAAVSGWTSTAISANDEIQFYVDTATTVTRVNLIIQITRA